MAVRPERPRDDAAGGDQWWISLNDAALDEPEPALWIFAQQLLQPLTR